MDHYLGPRPTSSMAKTSSIPRKPRRRSADDPATTAYSHSTAEAELVDGPTPEVVDDAGGDGDSEISELVDGSLPIDAMAEPELSDHDVLPVDVAESHPAGPTEAERRRSSSLVKSDPLT